jgi:AraC-like DNA-binding protein
LGDSVRFGAREASLVLDTRSWRTPLRTPDPWLRALLQPFCGAQVEAKDEDEREIGLAVRAALRDCLGRAKPTGACVARSLGLSERTMHRRLARAGQTFSDILDDIRREEAQRLLRETSVPVVEVAARLGFATQTSFHRAFVRWQGLAPARWRQRAASVDRTS